jgi:cyclic lactone autoinducer peptide
MRRINVIRRYCGTAFAFVALVVAQVASTQFSYVYYQDSVPMKVKELNNSK